MARLFWNTVNITDFGTGCWRELILVKSWIFIKMTFSLQMPALHRKLQRNFPNSIRNCSSQQFTGVTAWMSFCFIDNLLPLNSTSNMHHCQMFPWCITTAQDNRKPSLTFKRALSLRKRMGHLPRRPPSSLIWRGKQLLLPCSLHPTLPQNPTRNKIFQIHSNYQDIFRLHS